MTTGSLFPDHNTLRTRIKLCGLTSADEARWAGACGVNAVGFVLYPKSKRYVTASQARQIAEALPAWVTPVLLFVNPTVDEVAQALALLPWAQLQFHGHEDDAFCQQFGRPFIKAVPLQTQDDLPNALAAFPHAQALLVDCPSELYGGTGQSPDWSLLPEPARWFAMAQGKGLILSGGLHPGNVAELIGRFRPFAVDVSSGIEKKPQVDSGLIAAAGAANAKPKPPGKCPDTMMAFCQAVMRADSLGARAGDCGSSPQ